MLTSNDGEILVNCPIAAAVIRGMQSNPEDEKAWVHSNAPFQVGTDPVTLEVLRSMKPPRNSIRPSGKPDGRKRSTFQMCKYFV